MGGLQELPDKRRAGRPLVQCRQIPFGNSFTLQNRACGLDDGFSQTQSLRQIIIADEWGLFHEPHLDAPAGQVRWRAQAFKGRRFSPIA